MRIDSAVLLLSLAAVPASAGRRQAPPSPQALLRRALAVPDAAYGARVRVQSFPPGSSPRRAAKAQYRRVLFQPPGTWRIEVSGARAASPAYLLRRDAASSIMGWPGLGRAWSGPALPADAAGEEARLTSLYDLAVATGARAARKATWRLDMRSKADGRLRRSLWVGKTSGLVLRQEDYRPDGSLLRRERATRLEAPELGAAGSAAGFERTAPTSSTVPFRGPASPLAAQARFPAWTPVGYVLLAVSAAPGAVVLEYTDGLTPLRVRESAAAGREGAGGVAYARVRLRSSAGGFFLVDGGVELRWRAGGRDLAVSGDAAEADLARVADSIPDGR